MAKSGQADILELLFWTGIFEILAKNLVISTQMLNCASKAAAYLAHHFYMGKINTVYSTHGLSQQVV